MNINSVPIISIVIPMYNVEKYIAESVNSVLDQSFHHFELILVDDGCTDGTLDVLKQYDDVRIRIISQRNRGLSGARNTGIEASRGIYIALLDADDYWSKDKLAKHIMHLNHNPNVGVSYCPSLFVDEDSQLLGVGQFPKLEQITKQYIFCRNPVGNGSAAVIRRSLLDEIGYYGVGQDKYRKMYFNENLRQSEDIELWTRIAISTNWLFEGIEQPLTYYRVNEGGLSANLTKQFDCWLQAVELNKNKDPDFYKDYFQLAKAYQLRYMARRAVQSRSRIDALKLIHRALFCDIRILFQEPSRTCITFCCAWLKLLPITLYNKIELVAMGYLSQKKVS